MKIPVLLLFLFIAFAGTAQTTADAGADQSICISDTLKVIGKGLNAGDTGTYQWREIVTNKIVATSAYLVFKPTDTTTKLFELEVVKVINGIDYSDLDTFVLTTFRLPSFSFINLPGRCINDGCINLTLLNFARAYDAKTNSFGDVHYWQRRSPSWISGNPNQIWCPNINKNQVPKNGMWDTICFEYTDGNSCYNSECRPIKLYPNPDVKVNDGVFCQQNGMVSLDDLAVVPFNKVGGIQSWRVIGVPNGSGADPDAIIIAMGGTTPTTYYLDIGSPSDKHLTGNYYVEYCFKNPSSGCMTCDTGKIKVVSLPEFEFDTIRTVCANWLTPLDSFIHLKGHNESFTGAQWQCVEYEGSRNINDTVVNASIPNSILNSKNIKAKNSGQYLLKIEDITSGCYVSDSTVFTVLESPVVKIDVPDTICSNQQLVDLKSNHGNDTNGVWSGDYVSAARFYAGDAFKLGVGPFKVMYTYTLPSTLCKGLDSVAIHIDSTPTIDFQWDKKAGSDTIYDFSLTVPFYDSSKYEAHWNFGNGKSSAYKQPENVGFTLNDSFTITCIVTNRQGCADTLTKLLRVKSNSGLKSNLIQSIILFPNPGSGLVTIQTGEEFQLQITDVSGKTIMETGTVQTVSLPKGIYFFRFVIDGATIVKRVIVL
ncbi:MAG: T9SS type A sorting domain-containing protein [Bacteroidota bacterium]